MAQPFQILVTGHQKQDIDTLLPALKTINQTSVETRVLEANQFDPLMNLSTIPKVLIHHLGQDPERELQSIIDRPGRDRPALLVIGQPGGDTPWIMRLAMQAGARDFIIYPPSLDEVVREVNAVLREDDASSITSCTLTAFISPKGGGGASTVAEGVAHVLRAHYSLPTLLMDLDCQFGTQYLNLDLRPEKGLKEALDMVEGLDELALKGYVGQHPSGLHVLGTLPTQIMLPGEITEKRLNRLMELLMASYNQIVVDLPCTIDSTFSLIVERVRRIVLVVQQDFQNIRNAQKLNQILRDELQVPPSRIAVIINRYEASNTITIQDVEQALQTKVSGNIPSDYRSVNDAANLGVPLMSHAPKSPVTGSIITLCDWILGQPESVNKPVGFLQKLRQSLVKKKS